MSTSKNIPLRLLAFRLGNDRYAVDLESVVAVRRIAADQPDAIDLHARLGLDRPERTRDARRIEARIGRTDVAFLADEVTCALRLTDVSLDDAQPVALRGARAVIDVDGERVVVLDLEALGARPQLEAAA